MRGVVFLVWWLVGLGCLYGEMPLKIASLIGMCMSLSQRMSNSLHGQIQEILSDFVILSSAEQEMGMLNFLVVVH